MGSLQGCTGAEQRLINLDFCGIFTHPGPSPGEAVSIRRAARSSSLKYLTGISNNSGQIRMVIKKARIKARIARNS
jgi:hypothetical protein